jgi:hypothetical protein
MTDRPSGGDRTDATPDIKTIDSSNREDSRRDWHWSSRKPRAVRNLGMLANGEAVVPALPVTWRSRRGFGFLAISWKPSPQ